MIEITRKELFNFRYKLEDILEESIKDRIVAQYYLSRYEDDNYYIELHILQGLEKYETEISLNLRCVCDLDGLYEHLNKYKNLKGLEKYIEAITNELLNRNYIVESTF